MEWIKVSDRLPKPETDVLTYPNYRVLPYSNADGDFENTIFWTWSSYWDRAVEETGVTHWMPLPSPPTE